MSTATQRIDLFHTAEGPKELPCVCDPFFRCLYHWYYEVKMEGMPTPVKREEKFDERFPGRKPERDSGVRRDGAKNGHRSAKSVRGHGRRG